MTFVARILSLGVTIAIAFALTFGTARYGLTGTVLGLVGLLPLAALKRIAAGGGRTNQPLFGFAGTLGLLALNALALSAAVAAGVPDLGRLDFALVGVTILSVLWLHAVGLGHFLWGGLAVVGLAAGGVAFVGALFQTGWRDPQAASDIWWRSGWGSLAVAGLVCAAIGVVVRWASHRSSAVDDLPVPPTLATKWTARPALRRAAGPPVVPQAAFDARQVVGREP